jgi:RNA polymerase sigma factor (TIGR02999 family)
VSAEEGSVTGLLRELKDGDPGAMDRLMPLVYAELRRLSDNILRRERPGHTLQPTALVHEAYMRMVRQDQPDYNSRAQFYAIAGRVMRQILVDYARRRSTAKRAKGQGVQLDTLMESTLAAPQRMVELDDALSELERHDPQKARLIELKFFGGLTAEESATVTGLAVPEIRKHLRVAQAWLEQQLAAE